ncbi:hypothetical protein ATANTOWER_014103 [Ataeniobius toweri]|uniref:Uncharacterized protein n=1 Tax=Ataeniobius toweri TaxID=208326 RepID=A0ABU7C615_9TELE|nr:hypothetical protein [Ataeniobius toweri]
MRIQISWTQRLKKTQHVRAAARSVKLDPSQHVYKGPIWISFRLGLLNLGPFWKESQETFCPPFMSDVPAYLSCVPAPPLCRGCRWQSAPASVCCRDLLAGVSHGLTHHLGLCSFHFEAIFF